MNCGDIEPLLFSERDGVLTDRQRDLLSEHVAACPACRQLQARLHAALDSFKADAASVAVPDVNAAWRDLQARLHATEARPARKRSLAPIFWFSAPLAAAAAVALAFFISRPAAPAPAVEVAIAPPPPMYDPSSIAGADFVEAGDPEASTMIYVDKESGWLVVWATDGAAKTSG